MTEGEPVDELGLAVPQRHAVACSWMFVDIDIRTSVAAHDTFYF